MSKIFIQDIVAKMEGGVEQELPANTAIRFEINGVYFEVKIDTYSGRVSVRKNGPLSDPIIVYPQYQNKIEVG